MSTNSLRNLKFLEYDRGGNGNDTIRFTRLNLGRGGKRWYATFQGAGARYRLGFSFV
ncbi:MAG: hypothetical protein F6J97_18845 [Leptolyngbya sp. SIO4C1]|nr:hypothetical protein [Leptolyngbya sp. SIO4C1]